jgi:hypothetical protein
LSGIENELESKRKTAQTGTEQPPANDRPYGSWQPTSRLGSRQEVNAHPVPNPEARTNREIRARIGKKRSSAGAIRSS